MRSDYCNIFIIISNHCSDKRFNLFIPTMQEKSKITQQIKDIYQIFKEQEKETSERVSSEHKKIKAKDLHMAHKS